MGDPVTWEGAAGDWNAALEWLWWEGRGVDIEECLWAWKGAKGQASHHL